MYSKEMIKNKIDSLLSYSVESDPENAGAFESLISPVIDCVNSYFGANRDGFKIPLHDIELSMYTDIRARGTDYLDGIDRGFNNSFPKGYMDFTELFYQFPMMNVTPQEFYDAWIRESSVDEDTGVAAETVTGNTYITGWVDELQNAVQVELDNTNTLLEWLEQSLSDSGMVSLWEDTKEKNSPKRSEIAEELFDRRKLKECIVALNLPAYIPTYK